MATEESYPKLISLAVHELRTPASVVSGYLRMLQRDTDAPLSERQRRMVEEADKSCARLVSLIAALSEVGRIDDGQITMSPRTIDLFPLVAQVADSVHEAEEREVRLVVAGEPVGAAMAGDEARLRAAFAAVFHAILREKPGPCTVMADRRIVQDVQDGHDGQDGGQSLAVIIVAEEAGVQAAYAAPAGIFDDKRGGVGLSLAIARRVIEAHGGRLWSPDLADPYASRSTALIALPLGSRR